MVYSAIVMYERALYVYLLHVVWILYFAETRQTLLSNFLRGCTPVPIVCLLSASIPLRTPATR